MSKLAVYPGSFDPITKGHVDLIKRAHCAFDNLIVAVATNPRKKTLFTAEERVDLIKEALGDPRIVVDTFPDLLIHYINRVQASVILRGLRAISDFDYEFQMALTNRNLNPDVETYFLMASEPYIYLSSTMVKEIVYFGGDVTAMVPPNVLTALQTKIKSIRTDQL
ncbi:MAG TPA: pantetheine-phosphate adenylyltransferase [bacterium]|nr:pantetheine-phosphate adenylyltransferase [bacterium]